MSATGWLEKSLWSRIAVTPRPLCDPDGWRNPCLQVHLQNACMPLPYRIGWFHPLAINIVEITPVKEEFT